MSANSGSTAQAGLPALVAAERLFVIGGILLIIAGMIFGDIYAVFILHPNIADISRELAAATAAVAAQDAESVWQHFGALGGYLENAGTKKDAHVHIIHAGYIALLLAFVQPYAALSGKTKHLLARVFLAAAVVLAVSIFLIHYVGLVYSPLETIGWASIFADLSGLVLIVVCGVELVGLWRHFRGGRGPGGRGDPAAVESWESRVLLAGGLLLMLAGFLFGAYYAAVHQAEHATREITILTDVIERAAERDTDAAALAVGNYGALQGEKAVMIAAHAHVIEFGLLALMMAIAQPFVFLSRVWRRRLVITMLIGAVVLPVAVYAEQWYGLVAGGVADFAGLLVIVSLSGMLGGVLRYTGKMDAAEA